MSARERMRALAERATAPVRVALMHPAARAFAVLVLGLALVLLLLPPQDRGPTALTLAPGDIATADLHATHAFEVSRADPAEVTRLAEEAEAAVLPVWDHHPDRTQETVNSIRSAFDRVRVRLRQEALARAALLQEEGSGAEGPDALSAISESSLMTLLTAADRARVAQDDGAFSALLGAAEETDEIVRVMAADGFSLATEEALITLVTSPMSRFVIRDRRALDAIGSEGLVLRTIVDGEVTEERVVRDLRDFFGAAEVEDLVYAASLRLHLERESELLVALVGLAKALAQPNTELNAAVTGARRNQAAATAQERYVAERRVKFRPGERIVARGEVVTPEIAATLAEMARTLDTERRSPWPIVGLIALIVLWIPLHVELFRRHVSGFSSRPRDLAMMGVVLVAHLLLARVMRYVGVAIAAEGGAFPPEALLMLTPFAAGAVVVRVVTNVENAIAYSIVFSGLVSLLHPEALEIALFSLVCSVAAIAAMQRARTRTELLQSGVTAGVALACASLGYALFAGGVPTPDTAGRIALTAVASGLASAAVATFMLPVIETMFRYTTSLRLMELANLNHPALRDLVMKAPGTYHHSLMVGQLAEAACEAVGADALLGRVGAYFHDIGKSRNPQYFAENQSGSNPHARLKPHMSALVIRAHVKDGVEMARQHGLPERIIDFIREHHGTSRIGYFYQRAIDEGGEVDEGAFRYPGPRPQSRETAICLLADGVEAASRALPDPTPAALRQLVQKMVQRAQEDGQLDECGLTMRELRDIRESFIARLSAFYHHRPEYPEPRDGRPAGRPSDDWITEPETDAGTNAAPAKSPRPASSREPGSQRA